MSAREHLLVVEGSPYAYGTAGCSASTTNADGTDPGWGTAVILPDVLAYFSGDILSDVQPVEGVLSCGGMTFTLHDTKIPSGVDAGRYVITYFATKHPSNISSVLLTTDIVDSSADFTCANSTVLDAGGGVCWIDQEAIQYDAPTGSVYPIVTRGYYGSRQVDHISSEGRYPEAYTKFPGFTNRRCVLYRVDGTVATALWRGYLDDSPEQSGAAYAVSAKSAWDKIRDQRLGYSQATTQFRGYDMAAVAVVLRTKSSMPTVPSFHSYFGGPCRLDVCDTAVEIAQKITQKLDLILGSRRTNATNGIYPQVTASSGKLKFSCRFSGTERDGAQIGIMIAGEFGGWISATDDGTYATATIEADMPPACRSLFIGTSPSADYAKIHVDSVTGMPDWIRTTYLTDGFTTVIQPVLRAEYGDGFLNIEPTSITNDPPSLDNCAVALRPKGAGAINTATLGVRQISSGLALYAVIWITEPLTLNLAYRVTTNHWLYGLRYAVFRDTSYGTRTISSGTIVPDYLNAGLRGNDWDFTNTYDIVRAVTGIDARREWYLDGTMKVGPMVGDLVRFAGCSIVQRNSKLMIWPIQPPLPTSTLAAEFVEDDGVLGESASWSPGRGMLANAVALDVGDGRMRVVDVDSQRRYGQTKDMEVKLAGTDNFAAITISMATLGAYLLGKQLGNWTEPVGLVKISVAEYWAQTIKHGDYVRINSSYSLPDGRGGRGYTLTATEKSTTTRGMGQVISIRDGHGDGKCALTILQWGLFGFAGYSPCSRVSTISGAVLTLSRSYLTLATSTKNYDNSNSSSGDGGASKFRVGDRVKLLLRNSSTVTKLGGLVILSITSNTITLTTSPSATWVTYATGGFVDILYDDYSASGLQSNQKGYAWWGDVTTEVVAGTADKAPRWSP